MDGDVGAQLTVDTELLEYVCNENTDLVGQGFDALKSELKLAMEILGTSTTEGLGQAITGSSA